MKLKERDFIWWPKKLRRMLRSRMMANNRPGFCPVLSGAKLQNRRKRIKGVSVEVFGDPSRDYPQRVDYSYPLIFSGLVEVHMVHGLGIPAF